MPERQTQPTEYPDLDKHAVALHREFLDDPGAAIEELVENDVAGRAYAVSTLAAMATGNLGPFDQQRRMNMLSVYWIEYRMRGESNG